MSKFFKTASELQSQQKRVVDKLQKTDRLLVYHGLGSGKTLAALEVGKSLHLPVTIIGPASLKENFRKERLKHKVTGVKSKYYSYSKPPETLPTRDLLVFDEAQRMGRMESQRSNYPDRYKPTKTMFLTGTPIRNEPAELIPLMRGLDIKIPRDKAKFNEGFIDEQKQYPGVFARIFRGVKAGIVRKGKNLQILENAFKGKVDYFAPNLKDYPKIIKERIETVMSPRQQATYNLALKGASNLKYKIKHGLSPSKTEARHINAFLTATRQISNTPGKFNINATNEDAPKLNKAISEIIEHYKKDKNYKGVTYSAFLEHGIDPMEKRLKAIKIPYARFTGQTSDTDRKAIIKDFNSGKIKHLLLSGAGGEGLDLKGTKLLQILEPHWNDPTIEQVKGRVSRYQSHAHLPPKQRQVEIQTFISKPRKTTFFKRQYKGADEYLEMLSKQKADLNQEFLNTLQRASDG